MKDKSLLSETCDVRAPIDNDETLKSFRMEIEDEVTHFLKTVEH